MFSTGLSSGARGQEDRRDVFRHVEPARDVPSGSVEKQHGVGAFGDIARDFVEVKLHHVSVGVERPVSGRSNPERPRSQA
jgi:hypothetical protein